ncbi:MAG TPA: hypothetical protein VMS76_17150 [Planctomycetota bacterium]|nr:hypothetical protein [Planctomycetota bacterium]
MQPAAAAPSEPEPARPLRAAELPSLPQGTTLLALALLVTVTVSTYFDRRRALERSRAG